MKIRRYYKVYDCGDGSYHTGLFHTKEEAEAEFERELEEYGESADGQGVIDIELTPSELLTAYDTYLRFEDI